MNNEYFDMAKLGTRISHLRKEHNMTQGRLAEELGVSHQAISSWENGLTSPDIAKLKELSRIFNVTIDSLMDNRTITKAVEKLDHDEPLSEEEFVHVAPLLKPSEVEDVIEDSDTEGFDLSSIVALLPFIDSDVINAWLKKHHAQCTLTELTPVFPFLDTEGFRILLENRNITARNAVSLFPFLNDEHLESIAKIELETKSLNEIVALAPFLNEKMIDALALEVVKEKNGSSRDIVAIAPFLSSKGMKAVLREILNRDDNADVSSILPFID